MKFWKHLCELIDQTFPEWRDKFLTYKDLKKQLRLIYPKDGETSCNTSSVVKRRKLADDGGAEEEEVVTKEVIDFVRLLEDEIDKFNAFFVDKEEEYIIRLKVLQDRVAEVQDSNEELMTVGREIVDFHGEMVLLFNYSALNYTGLVKILKKYDKRSGALIRLPFIQKVLHEPCFTTDILNKLVKECERMLDPFFSMNEQLAASYQAAKGKEELNTPTITTSEGRLEEVPEELAEIKNIQSMYMTQTLKALEVLNKIRSGSSTACSLQSNKLELHFRPEDPYSHPAFGELQPCNNFLLKITKKAVRNGQDAENTDRVSTCLSEDEIHLNQKSCTESVKNDQHVDECQIDSITAPTEVKAQLPEEVQEDLSADIVARVSEAYHFNDVAQRKKRNWADMEPQFEKCGLMDVDQEDLMILVPLLFSIKDVPEKVVLKPTVSLSSKKKQRGVVQHRWEMDIEPSLAIDFNIKEIPKKVYWEKYIPKDSEQWDWQMAVCKLFDERPIWIKSSVAERLLDKGLQFADHLLRRLLFRTAYYFSNGPFLRFWIKKGYDPRKDPESRIYQRIDFRVPPSLRSYCDANMAAGLKHRWEDICSFRVFPYKCQTSLQFFELADNHIQQEIRKPPQQATCTCATGWFSSSVLGSLRFCVAVRFLSVYPMAGAEALLKSASERFEKSKRMQIYTKELRLEEEIQQVNAELVDREDKEELNDDDDEDEEEEIDDDNVEEEVDPYEAGEDENFAPQPCSYMGNENISKNYLQELFGSFPSGEVGGGHGLQDADNSDGEYQIYEQYSDGNYSNEDDDY